MTHEPRPFQNKVKRLLAEGKTAWGADVADDSELAAKITVNTGIDFLWIDTEHSPIDVLDIRWIPLLCRSKGCEPIVRVAGLQPDLIKKALDIGASGIMVPQVNSADEARRAVEYCKYAPQGSRGVSPLWPIFADVPLNDYLPAANEETCVVVQIETAAGIRNLEEICAVEGVDVVLAGPLDLSAALGHIGQMTHPAVQQFLAELPRRAAACGKPAGIPLSSAEAAGQAYQQGYRFIVVGSLLGHGSRALKSDLESLRQLERGR